MFKHCRSQNLVDFSPVSCTGVPVFKKVNGVVIISPLKYEPVGTFEDYCLDNLINANVPIKEINFNSSSSLDTFDNVSKVVNKILRDDEDKNA